MYKKIMQRKYGLGKLMASWFDGRRYSFKFPGSNKVVLRGEEHNAGVPPGTILGVTGFTEFMETCPQMTEQVDGVIWPSLYADDFSPLTSESQVTEFQRRLDEVFNWSKCMKVNFHLEGSKGPKYMTFIKKGQTYPDCFDSIVLGPASAERISSQTYPWSEYFYTSG